MWQPGPPATDLALAGAELLVNISASPFHVGKERDREEMFVQRARDNVCFVAFCNAVGGQDELIFDGHSCVLDDEGEVLARAPGFEEALLVVDVEPNGGRSGGGCATCAGARSRASGRSCPRRSSRCPSATRFGASRSSGCVTPIPDDLEQMRLALELGLRDYVDKNGFSDVVLGLSGGIDSALTAALAAEALGPERVHCVSMPSRYSSEGTRGDAQRLAENLGCDFRELPIGPVVEAYDRVLAEPFAGRRGRPDRGEPPGAGARRRS